MGGEPVAADLADVHDVALARPTQVHLAVLGHPVAAFLPDGRCRLVAHCASSDGLVSKYIP